MRNDLVRAVLSYLSHYWRKRSSIGLVSANCEDTNSLSTQESRAWYAQSMQAIDNKLSLGIAEAASGLMLIVSAGNNKAHRSTDSHKHVVGQGVRPARAWRKTSVKEVHLSLIKGGPTNDLSLYDFTKIMHRRLFKGANTRAQLD